MIVVTDIKYIQVNAPEYLYLVKADRNLADPWCQNQRGEDFRFDALTATKVITGEQFVNWNGEPIMLGLCQEARELLQLPTDAFKSAQRKINALSYELGIRAAAVENKANALVLMSQELADTRAHIVTLTIVVTAFAILLLLGVIIL